MNNLFKQLQDEMYQTIKNKPNISKKEIEEKMGLEVVDHGNGKGVWSDEFYAIIYPLLNEKRIKKISRGHYMVI